MNLRYIFLSLVLSLLTFLVVWYHMANPQKREFHLLPMRGGNNRLKNSSGSPHAPNFSVFNVGFSSDVWTRIQQAIYWEEPDRPITSLSMTTSPEHSKFFILNRRENYQVGDEMYVTVVAKDFNNNTKPYGGDFFEAKVFSSALKASVFGEVQDHSNGSYTIRFLLPWVGQAEVAVRLMYSSEAVQILKHHRDSYTDRISYLGVYVGTNQKGKRQTETVECNVKWEGNRLGKGGAKDCCCEYSDPGTGEVWQCRRPKNLPCSKLVMHNYKGQKEHLTTFQKAIFSRARSSGIQIGGDHQSLKILPSNRSFAVTTKCRPGVHTPVPAGFYFKDSWTSLVCNIHQFTPSQATRCLKDKLIYIMGDSTTRQWFEYLIDKLPGLKLMNLHNIYHPGPHLAVDVRNNLVVHWRGHGLPVRWPVAIKNLHYISNEIAGLAGGPDMVIVFHIGVHFASHPLLLYVRRIKTIRQAVLALLTRAPKTTVIIKTLNTGCKGLFCNDWYSMQFNMVLTEAFRNIPVFILDVWQMTSCHYIQQTHPISAVIRDETNILLSFICPV